MTIKKVVLCCLLLAAGLSYSLPAGATPICSGQKCSELSGKGKCGKKKGSCEKGSSSEKGSSNHSS